MKITYAKLFGAFVIFVLRSFSATLTYQPSPYKGTDLWITNYYSYNDDYGVNDGRLRVGGWGDVYYSAIKFDLEGLPQNPTQVVLALFPYSVNDGSTVVPMNVARLTSEWNENSGWFNTTWMGISIGSLPAPTNFMWNGMNLTSVYKLWKSGAAANHGILLMPQANNNRFNTYYSSDSPTITYRPFLQITYDETVTPPNFRLPLPGGRKWVVTTEIGGLDHKYPNKYRSDGTEETLHHDEFHDNNHSPGNYFSIDFGTASSPQYSGDIPILAAANGRVVNAEGGENHPNGYFVVIDHDNDGNLYTGFSTRYLHMKYQPEVRVGDFVMQGKRLGYMGNTGRTADGKPTSHGTHLHFGVRYNNQGYSWIDALTFVKLEGLHMKQYQTEVDVNGNRHINSYFLSTNTP